MVENVLEIYFMQVKTYVLFINYIVNTLYSVIYIIE